MSEKLKQFTEFETKYSVESEIRLPFKELMEKQENLKDFVYVESDDIYYVKGDEFLRHRFSDDKKIKRAELTYKSKRDDKDNVVRKEINARVDANSVETIAALCSCLGYENNFSINKYCDIYHFNDATLVYYTVRDKNTRGLKHFIEIEVDEELIPSLTEEEAWDIIRKWETVLQPLGLKPQNRLRKSLFEIYRRTDAVSKA